MNENCFKNGGRLILLSVVFFIVAGILPFFGKVIGSLSSICFLTGFLIFAYSILKLEDCIFGD